MIQETDLIDSPFELLCRKDNTSFWKAWHKRFCMNNLKPISQLNGKCGVENILEEFSDPFGKISQPNTVEADSSYKKQVETYLSSTSYLPTTQPIVNSSGSKVHCAFLDASKAFAKILHYGRFV